MNAESFVRALVAPGTSWNWRDEIVGGLTTWVACAYIVVVNPAILSFAGIPTGPSTVATALTAALGTLLMAFVARRPYAVAPYMGENAFLAFGLAAFGITWQQRLGAVFLAGALFLALTLAGMRQRLADAITPSLKHAFGVAIGFFLLEIGLYQCGVIASALEGVPAETLVLEPGGLVGAPPVPLKMGDWSRPEVGVALLGFGVTWWLVARRIPGALLLGMLAAAAISLELGLAETPDRWWGIPFQGDLSLGPIAFQLDVTGILQVQYAAIFFTLALMGFLDTLGTLVALGALGGELDREGRIPNIERPMIVDAVASMLAALLGTSTTGAYIESATGIREGARTGIAAAVVGLGFLLLLVLAPAAAFLQSLPFVYGPALIVVGLLMLGTAKGIEFEDPAELLPAAAAIALTVFTFNIANGLASALLLAPIARLVAGRAREVRLASWVLAGLAGSYFLFGIRH